MILYQTWNHFWWLRHGGSAIVKLNTVIPAFLCMLVTAWLQDTDADFCARLNNRNTASYSPEELAQLDAIGGCDDSDTVVKWQHPYAHQAFTLCVTFLLTYRSQLAYQRFWEARTHMTMMSNRWSDAAMSLYIFDDQCSEQAKATRDNYRGKLLHLMSLLHCFACLHLMRREEVEKSERESDGIQENGATGQDGNQVAEEEEEEEEEDSSRSSMAAIFKDCRTPPNRGTHKHNARPAHRQLDRLLDARWFRIRRCCRADEAQVDRYDLGVMGDLQEGERRALYPPWDVTSSHIENVLYRNHELPDCCHHGRDQKLVDGGTKEDRKALRKERMRKVVEANMFDRVSLIMGWIMRLVGERKDMGGLGVVPPVLSRPYQNLSDGHLAFGMCKKIRDTPFPFPYAQLMKFLLVIFCLSFPFVSTWAVPAQDNGVWDARILSFVICLSLFALNEVARELEVPFHVAHNDINIEELHDEYLSMLETLHTNFSKPTELGFHNDLREKVITPEHIFNRACNCAKCDEADRRKYDKAGNKAQMVWNTTDNATTKEDNDLRKILDKPHFDWQGHDFHELQALRLSKLQRRRNEEARFADDSELVCLQLAARVRERIPSFWTSERQLTFIQDVDVWLLLEAKYEMISRWRMKVVQQDGSVSPTPATGGKLGGGMPRNRGGGYSVRGMDVEEVNPSWVVAQLRDWDRHTDSALKILRTSPRSLLGSTLNVGAEEREPECELMYLWKRILEVKRGGDGTDVMALTLEEQDWLDHSSVFMSSRLTENEHDAQTCKNNIKAYRETLNTSIEPARLYNENLIRIMNRIPEIDGRPLTADEELKLGALKLAVLDSKEKDYKEFLKEKEKDPATLTAVKQKEWRANLKRLEDAKLDEQEQVDLDSLKRQKYDRIFKGVKLKELRPMAIIAKPFDKFEQLWTDDEKAEFEQQKAEQKAKDDQEAYLGLLDDPAYADALTTEQVASRKMLQLLRFYRLKRMGAFDPWSDPPRGDQADLLEYQDLQKTELDRRKDGGEELTPDENQERDQLWVSVLQREARETLTIDEAETLYALLKAQLSDNKRDEELLEWLDMRRNQLHLQKMKEKAHAAGKAEENLEEDVKYVAQLIGFEQANIKVLERHQFDADFSDQKDLDLLKAKQAVRAKAKNEKNMKQTVAEGLELIELTKSIQIGLEAPSRLERTSDQSSVAVFEQIQQTIEKLEVEELIGMRTETEEDILDKLYVRQLEWKLMRIADSLVKEVSECSPVGSGDGGGSGEGEDEESLKARREELAGERERTAYELERRQRTILVREKAHAARDLKEAVKEVGRRETELKEQKELGDTGALQSPREKPAGDAEAGGETGSEMEPGEVVDAIREVDEQDQADLSYVEHEMSKANEDVSQKRADMDRIDAELDQLLLQDLERRKEKGLLNSDEEHQLDVQIKRVLKRKEHAGELPPVDMQKLMDAELRLLERKDGNQKEFLDDDEQIELDLRRFHSLSQKKIHDGGFTVSDEKMLESVIVAIYTRRKVYAKQQAMKLATEISMEGAESTADGDGGAGKQHAKLIFDEQLWSSDEDLDLKRYELKQLERQSETKQLDVADVEMVYNLRCEMIDGLEERIKGRKDILAMERGFTSLNISGLRHVPEPEPEPEPELEPVVATPGRKGASVSFSMRVDIDSTPSADDAPDVSDTTLGGVPLAGLEAPDDSDASIDQLPDLRLIATPCAMALAETVASGLDDVVHHPLSMGHKLPSGLTMLPQALQNVDSPFGSPVPSSPRSFVSGGGATPLSLRNTPGGWAGATPIGDSLNMSHFGSVMVSPKAHESQIEDGVSTQRLLSKPLAPADEERELQALKRSLKAELIQILTSTLGMDGGGSKPSAAATATGLSMEQQARLLSLAEGNAAEQVEIQQLIEGTSEKNRPKSMRGDGKGRTLADIGNTGGNGGGGALKKQSSRLLLVPTSSFKAAGVAAQLALQVQVAQSVNPTRTLRRTISDVTTATPRRTASTGDLFHGTRRHSGSLGGAGADKPPLTRRSSGSLDVATELRLHESGPSIGQEAEMRAVPPLIPADSIALMHHNSAPLRTGSSQPMTVQEGRDGDEEDEAYESTQEGTHA